MIKSLDEIRDLLDTPLDLDESEREEDLQIIQPDGSRACITYELATKGYHLVKDEMYVGSRK